MRLWDIKSKCTKNFSCNSYKIEWQPQSPPFKGIVSFQRNDDYSCTKERIRKLDVEIKLICKLNFIADAI